MELKVKTRTRELRNGEKLQVEQDVVVEIFNRISKSLNEKYYYGSLVKKYREQLILS